MWGRAFGKPIMTFEDIDHSEIIREDKRKRDEGLIVQDVKRIVSTSEIGKATVTRVDTNKCDEAAEVTGNNLSKSKIYISTPSNSKEELNKNGGDSRD